jgi:hypothetical protein
MPATVITLFILNSSLCAEQVQIPSNDIQTIDTFGTATIPGYKDEKPYKATISIDDKYKGEGDIDLLKFMLMDEQENKVFDKILMTTERHFVLEVVDLDGDEEKDFVLFVRKKDFRHISKTLVILRRVWRKGVKEVLSMPYAGETNEGIKWKYNHSYFRQDDGNIHIKLALEHGTSRETDSSLPVKTRWINIADRGFQHDLQESEPPDPMQLCFRKEEYFIPNLLGGEGYTIRAHPKKGSYPSTRDPLRTIQVVDKDGSVIAERPFRAYFGGYWLGLFDFDADGDKEFIFIFHTGSGTGYMGFVVSIDKIFGGQFIQLVTFPIAEASSYTGDWGFSEWKYLGYGKVNSPEVAFEMILNYSTSSLYKGDSIPDNFPRAHKMLLLFRKDIFSINTIYPENLEERPRENAKVGSNWIFK